MQFISLLLALTKQQRSIVLVPATTERLTLPPPRVTVPVGPNSKTTRVFNITFVLVFNTFISTITERVERSTQFQSHKSFNKTSIV